MIEGYLPGLVRVDPVGVAPAEVVAQALRCERLEAVAEAARAFVAMTSVFRQRRDCRPEFEALCIALLEERRVDALVAAGATGKGDGEA